MKRLIYNFDGTSNEYDAAYPTNVVMMDKAIAKLASDGIKQQSLYLSGVGTKTGEKAFGGAFGYGLFENIEAAYKHLCKNYTLGDEIYIFGFSRGAYTARSFAGMIGWCGIIDQDKSPQIDSAKKYYKQRLFYLQRLLLKQDAYVEEFNQWRMKNSSLVCANADDKAFREQQREDDHSIIVPDIININYIGVWDTVRTLGLTDKLYKWHDDDLSSSVKSARHAIALDERRRKFNVTTWDNINKLNQDFQENGGEGTPYQQLWFPGTHGSVGGGGRIRGLSDEAFQWIKEGAKKAGLEFIDGDNAEIFSLQPNPLTWLFNSVGEDDTLWKKTKKFGFKVLYFALGMIDRKGPESIDDVHQSTIIRYFAPSQYISEKKSYRPTSLKKIHHALALKGSPFSDDQYRALHETTKRDADKDTGLKEVTISGKQYFVHTVTKGESLSIIAENLTGDEKNYRTIHKVNRASIPDVDFIYIGQKILIPSDLIALDSEA